MDVDDILLLERIWPPSRAEPGWVTQIGGRPRLPAAISWPGIVLDGVGEVPLDFLAQIRLADLTPTNQRHLLPSRGTLFFFALALADRPLADFGPGASRVIFIPDDVDDVPFRPPPPEAGWSRNPAEFANQPACAFRDPALPRSELFPRCPVMPVLTRPGPDGTPIRLPAPAGPPEQGRWHRRDDAAALRVADGILELRAARNFWLEGQLPLDGFLRARGVGGHRRRQGWRRWLDRLLDRQQAGPASVAEALDRVVPAYERWRAEAIALTTTLEALPSWSLLTPDQQAAILHIGDRCTELGGTAGITFPFRRPDPGLAQAVSLHELLLACPEFETDNAAEVAAAHPARLPMILRPSRLLGSPHEVQGGVWGGGDQLLLLQLESDWYGPRFQWWDMGNITFVIDAKAAKDGRFDTAWAEIEAY